MLLRQALYLYVRKCRCKCTVNARKCLNSILRTKFVHQGTDGFFAVMQSQSAEFCLNPYILSGHDRRSRSANCSQCVMNAARGLDSTFARW
jgi:hypothetical protein